MNEILVIKKIIKDFKQSEKKIIENHFDLFSEHKYYVYCKIPMKLGGEGVYYAL